MLTWSLGWAPSPARLAITSLAFMFEEVPEPVWKTSTGNWSSCSPSAIERPASAMRSARSASSPPSAPLASAAAPLIRPSQRTTGTGTRSPETGKLSTALVVSPPHNCSGMRLLRSTVSSGGSVSSPIRADELRREGLVAWRVASGHGEAADQVGVDAFAPPGPSLRRPEQVAELDARLAAGIGLGFGIEAGGRLDHRFADPREVAAGLPAHQAVADRRLPTQKHFPRGCRKCPLIGAGSF